MPDVAAAEPSLATIMKTLNEQQRRAVTHDGGPFIVLAGPGAGKTRVIVARVARLLAPRDDGGAQVEPESVLALAFTIKSAQELRDRLNAIVGPRLAQRVQALTSHAFGKRILDRFGDMIGLPATLRIMDSAQRTRLLRSIVCEHPLFHDCPAPGLERAVRDADSFISACTTDGVSPEALKQWCEQEAADLRLDTERDDLARAAAQQRLLRFSTLADVYARFNAARLPKGLLVFDDFINLAARVLREHAAARTILRDEVRHIVIDEFQDWSPAQIQLLAQLAPADGARPPDLCVVGDDDQAIYAFRGADDRAFERFARQWPEHDVIALSENYRSGSAIIDAGNAIIRRASTRFYSDKTIAVGAASAAEQPGIVEGALVSDNKEIGAAIAAMIRIDRKRTNRPWSDYAVITRTNSNLDAIALTLSSYDIPVASPVQPAPLSDAGVQDLLAWMQLLVDPSDALAARRLLYRPPYCVELEAVARLAESFKRSEFTSFVDFLRAGPTAPQVVADFCARYDQLRAFAAEHTAERAVRRIVEEAHLIDAEALDQRTRVERTQAIIAALRFVQDKQPRLEPPGDLAAFMRHYADLNDTEKSFCAFADERLDHTESDDDEQDAVAILTAHKAKGLEFDTVFVANVRARGFPSVKASEPSPLPPELTGRDASISADEERRLFYVACTRAQRRLVLLANSLKRKPKEGDYFDEVTALSGLETPVHSSQDLLREAELITGDLADPEGAESGRRAWVLREMQIAKQEAATALHRAERAGVSAEELNEIGHTLTAAAAKLAVYAHLRDGAPAPQLPDAAAFQSVDVNALAEQYHAGRLVDLCAPLKAPLRLSFSTLSDYDRCPRCFYLKHVMGLDEIKTPGLAVGDAVHKALEQFFREVQQAEGEGRPAPGLARLHQLAERILHEQAPDGDPDGVMMTQINAQLTGAFESLHTPDSEILEIERKITFKLALACGVHDCTAKIDRIDRAADGAFRLIDYKTGAASKKLLEPEKTDLQLCLYALALREHFSIEPDEPLEGVAEYWLLSSTERGVIALSDLNIDKALDQINTFAEGMLRGDFARKASTCKGLCALLPE